MSLRRMGIIAVGVIAALSTVVAISAGATSPGRASLGVCQPEIGSVWGVEGQPLRIPVVCGTGYEPGPGEVVLSDAPPGVELMASSRTIEWTPELDQAATYEIGVQVAGEPTTVTVGVGDAWSDPDNVPLVEPARLTLESGLPVFHLVTDPSIGPDAYTDARITYGGHQYTGASAKLRGSLSLQYEKNNYTLRFDPADPFADPAIPGLDGSLKLVLNGDFDDNSHLRNRLAFELWNQMSPSHLQIEHASAVVYVDGAYVGLYTVTDQIGEEFLTEAGFAGGELYKAVGHRADFTSSNESLAARELEQKVPDPDDTVVAEPAVFDLYEFVDRSTSSQFRVELGERVVLDDFVDWFVLVSLVGAGDSTAKNAYVYAPADGAGFRALPWDFNHSFGQDFVTNRVAPGETMPSTLGEGNRLFERLIADPELVALVRARATEVLGGVGSAEAVDDVVGGLLAEIDGAARRDEVRWADTYRATAGWAERTDFTTFEQEVDLVGTWYGERIRLLADDLEQIAS